MAPYSVAEEVEALTNENKRRVRWDVTRAASGDAVAGVFKHTEAHQRLETDRPNQNTYTPVTITQTSAVRFTD